MTRFPDGIDGKSFYQKDAPEFAPEWIRTFPIWSEDTQRDIRYFVCDDVESLLYIANLGSIPMHIWNSRVGSLEQPDWCVIDLDPKEAPFSDVIRTRDRVARAVRVDRAAELREDDRQDGPAHSRCRSAGSSRTRSAARSANCSRASCCASSGDIATITRHVTKRGDKVYLDYLQNRHGQLIVAPFSVRPLPGATVSMPLRLGRGRPVARPAHVHDQERGRADGATRGAIPCFRCSRTSRISSGFSSACAR